MFWTDYTLWHKLGIWQNFAVTSLETLNMKFAINKLSFPLVTHVAYSNGWFDSYEILKSGQGSEHCPDRLDIQMNNQVLRV
jgi:hypothetical protein